MRHKYLPRATAGSPLGSFLKLPPEIRYEIWRYVISEKPSATVPRRIFFVTLNFWTSCGLEIMRTSRQIYDEVHSILYSGELCFRIQNPRWLSPPQGQLIIKNQSITKGLPWLQMEDLRSIPVSNFKCLRFEIAAPRPRKLWGFYYANIKNIVSRLRADTLPRVDIVFLDRELPKPPEVMSQADYQNLLWSHIEFHVCIMAFTEMKKVDVLRVKAPLLFKHECAKRAESDIRSLRERVERTGDRASNAQIRRHSLSDTDIT